MKYLKKVSTTPVRGNGFIIDSFNSTDNKHFNAPSINAVENYTKTYVNDTTDADGILFCGDFVNVPTSSIFDSMPRDAHYALGWNIPEWLTWVETKGLKIDKTYEGDYDGLYTPKYRNRHFTLAQNGINKAVVSVEWSKDGDSEIHTSTRVITDTTTNYAWSIVELESNIYFRINSFYASNDSDDFGGTTRFGLNTSGTALQGDYYIRKIKIEKGSIPTPFGLNKEQFVALSTFYNLVIPRVSPIDTRVSILEGKNLELSGNIITDASGSSMSPSYLPDGWTLDNTLISCIAIKVGDEVYTNTFNGSSYTGNKDVEFSAKLRLIDGSPCFVIYFKDETQANKTLPFKIVLYKSVTSFT